MIKLHITFLAFMIIFGFMIPLNSNACSFRPSIAQEFHSNDLVFTGRLESINCTNHIRKVEFIVHDIWKGKIQEKYYFTEQIGKECLENKNLSIGNKYHIFTKYKNSNEITSPTFGNTCSSGYDRVPIFWHEWDKKTKYRKFILRIWFKYALEKSFKNDDWLKKDIFKYWIPSYDALGKPKYTFNNQGRVL